MSAAENIERLVKKFYAAKKSSIATSAEMDKKVLDDALQALEKSKKAQLAATQPNIWRIIMKSKITKLAAAAVIILAVGLLVTILHQSATPAWAIDQTIEALKEIDAIYLSGTFFEEDGSEAEFEAWARPNPKDSSISGDFRLHEGNKQIAVTSMQKDLTYVYHPRLNVVHISGGINRFCYPWLGSDFFRKMRQNAKNWQETYGQDEETGSDCVFVTFTYPSSPGPRFWWIQFDLQTKRPVRLKLWYNKNYEGEPAYNCWKIVYDPELPESIFEFDVPERAKIIDHIELSKLIRKNPTYGIVVEEPAKKEACKKVVEEYWQAVIKRDWPRAQKMRPLADRKIWEELQAMYSESKPVELIEVKEPYALGDEGTYPRVPYLIKMKDGKFKKGILYVKFEHIEGKRVGVVVDSYGPEF